MFTLTWLYARICVIINFESFNPFKKDNTMADKPAKDLQTFIENVNKKDKVNGKKVRFGFTKRKRK